MKKWIFLVVVMMIVVMVTEAMADELLLVSRQASTKNCEVIWTATTIDEKGGEGKVEWRGGYATREQGEAIVREQEAKWSASDLRVKGEIRCK